MCTNKHILPPFPGQIISIFFSFNFPMNLRNGRMIFTHINHNYESIICIRYFQIPTANNHWYYQAGGRNAVLETALSKRIPLVSDYPTIIIGADVTHPQPGEDSSPSIAAVSCPLVSCTPLTSSNGFIVLSWPNKVFTGCGINGLAINNQV